MNTCDGAVCNRRDRLETCQSQLPLKGRVSEGYSLLEQCCQKLELEGILTDERDVRDCCSEAHVYISATINPHSTDIQQQGTTIKKADSVAKQIQRHNVLLIVTYYVINKTVQVSGRFRHTSASPIKQDCLECSLSDKRTCTHW